MAATKSVGNQTEAANAEHSMDQLVVGSVVSAGDSCLDLIVFLITTFNQHVQTKKLH